LLSVLVLGVVITAATLGRRNAHTNPDLQTHINQIHAEHAEAQRDISEQLELLREMRDILRDIRNDQQAGHHPV